MRSCLVAASAAAAAAAAAAVPGSLAFLRCGSLTPAGVCTPGSVELAAVHLAGGNSTVVLRFPHATEGTLELQNLALAPSADALFVSIAGAGEGQLVRVSLSTRAVVSTLAAPACAFLAVDDTPNPTHVLCLTDAPYWGVDGRSYLLRLDLAGGAPTVLATWGGSPVPVDVFAVYDPGQGVLYAALLDEAAQEEYLLGWDVGSGALASQVTVPASVAWVAAAWDSTAKRVLSVVNNYTSAERVVGAVDLASGDVDVVVSKALTPFTAVYGVAAWAPGVGSLLVTTLGRGNALRLVGVNATSGKLDLDGDASGILGSFVYVGEWGG